MERLSLTLWYHGAASVSRGLYWDNVWEMERELGKERRGKGGLRDRAGAGQVEGDDDLSGFEHLTGLFWAGDRTTDTTEDG